MSRLYHVSGNDRHWSFDPRPQDASLRYRKHGKVRPMIEPRQGFLAKLFGRQP